MYLMLQNILLFSLRGEYMSSSKKTLCPNCKQLGMQYWKVINNGGESLIVDKCWYCGYIEEHKSGQVATSKQSKSSITNNYIKPTTIITTGGMNITPFIKTTT